MSNSTKNSEFINKTIHGLCIDVLKNIESDSIDSIVTDPPYGISFMGKKWDYDVPSIEDWKECLRVLKPGGHLLSFAGTRTQHRMAVNIEDAGFEIRDMISWVYGSGFPKSHNISKAIDKKAGAEREVVGHDIEKAKKQTGQSGTNSLNDRKGNDGVVTASSTPEAQQWNGWGTALKPACEPITVARKPLSEKTIVENVLKHGTGGINIDECRVETDEEIGRDNRNIKNSPLTPKDGWNENSMKGLDSRGKQDGRWPANFIHDGSDEVKELFPDKKGWSSQKHNYFNPYGGNALNESETKRDGIHQGYNDNGSAARFFYSAKASKKERGEHNNHPTVKPIALMEYLVKLITPKDGICLDPFIGSGTTLLACINLDVYYIGIDKELESINIANKRIKDHKS